MCTGWLRSLSEGNILFHPLANTDVVLLLTERWHIFCYFFLSVLLAARHKWDWEAASEPDGYWICTHCRGCCPERAQCAIYKKTNERRREQQQQQRARMEALRRIEMEAIRTEALARKKIREEEQERHDHFAGSVLAGKSNSSQSPVREVGSRLPNSHNRQWL